MEGCITLCAIEIMILLIFPLLTVLIVVLRIAADASDRMGDLIAIPHGGLVLLDPERADKEGAMVGHHGGVSEIESTVALLSRAYL